MARGRPKKIKDAAEINAIVDDVQDVIEQSAPDLKIEDAPDIVLAKPFPKAPDAAPLHPAFVPQAAVVAEAPKPVHYTPPDILRAALRPYTSSGLRIVHLDDKSWHFAAGLKEDSGTLHQPLPNIMKCVTSIMTQARVIQGSDQL